MDIGLLLLTEAPDVDFFDWLSEAEASEGTRCSVFFGAGATCSYVLDEPRDALRACEELVKEAGASQATSQCLSYPFSSKEGAGMCGGTETNAEGEPRTVGRNERFESSICTASLKNDSKKISISRAASRGSEGSAEYDNTCKTAARRWRLTLGYDTEHTPVPTYHRFRIPTTPLRVLQLSSLHTCAVFLLGPLGGLPRCVASLLEDPTVLKVTQGAPVEVKQLSMEFGVHAKGFFCLHTASSFLSRSRVTPTNSVRGASNIFCKSRGLSLQALCQLYLGEVLPKDLQQSDWGSDALSDDQIQYAATDAHVSLRVFQAMTANLAQSNVDALMKLMSSHHATG